MVLGGVPSIRRAPFHNGPLQWLSSCPSTRAITEVAPKLRCVGGRPPRGYANKLMGRHVIILLAFEKGEKNLQKSTKKPTYATNSTVRMVSLPSTRLAQIAEYSGTSSQVDVSTVRGSDVTRIKSELAAPPIIFHSPSWKS